jgi:hypothetical protein
MTPEAVHTLFGSSIAVGLVIGAVIAFANSWRV